jgi:Mn2+/Fe2+ NRAMP family transporter
VIVTGTLLYQPGGANIQSAAEAAHAIMPTNSLVGTLLAIGLFDAGLLGAICISLATSWAVGEVFGWAHSLNKKVREAPWFYGFYFFALITAGAVVLIPGAPLVLITLFVQVIAVTLLPAALVFLILLLNSEELMGKFKNTLAQNIISYAIVIMIVALSTMYGLSVLFPRLFG